MKKYSSYFLVLLISFQFHAFSAVKAMDGDSTAVRQTTDTRPLSLIKSDFSKAADDGMRLVKAPFHFTTGQWVATGAILGGTALAFAFDEDMKQLVARNHTELLDKLTPVGKNYGEVYTAAAISGVVYLGGLVSGSGEVRETGRMLFESLAFAGIITSVLKSALGRSRPYMDEGAFKYRGFQFKTETTSLPSGHATVAFSVSSVLASRINNVYASIGLYGLAGFTAFQRIYDNKHWLSDTFLGAAIGTVIGQAIVHYGTGDNNNGGPLSLQPSLNGFSIQIAF